MSKLYEQVCTWENFNLAWRKAARGKRGREPAASFDGVSAAPQPITAAASANGSRERIRGLLPETR